ncbi:DUF6771 family protein [Sphingomonas sp. PWP1-2]|uniref:DUF6771 family protein n=1 Tax=Sphingomonas sp. PWP1-2 TaxID=2804558 RepID=UPI003CF6BFA9
MLAYRPLYSPGGTLPAFTKHFHIDEPPLRETPCLSGCQRPASRKTLLAILFFKCSAAETTHAPNVIAEAILSASGFARVGITMPQRYMRWRAALDLASTIAHRLDHPQTGPTRSRSRCRFEMNEDIGIDDFA